MRYSYNYIDKAIFLVLYKETHYKVFGIESTIANSFTGAGLILFNPQHVLDKLTIQLYTPIPLRIVVIVIAANLYYIHLDIQRI